MQDIVQLIATAAAGGMITAGGVGSIVTIRDLIQSKCREYRKENIQFREPNEKELVIGYQQFADLKIPIMADMKRMPHLLVSGLSQQGKSSMVEYAVRNKQVMILNALPNNFQSVDAIERIEDQNEMIYILNQLIQLKENKETLYVVIDELLQLSIDGKKEITNLITKLLAKAAHNNIYIIGITQSAEKEILKCKHLFNTRVCFRMVEDSSYKTALGYQPEDPCLQQREFYYLTDRKGIGQTYDLSL